jgi:hypothetical protein
VMSWYVLFWTVAACLFLYLAITAFRLSLKCTKQKSLRYLTAAMVLCTSMAFLAIVGVSERLLFSQCILYAAIIFLSLWVSRSSTIESGYYDAVRRNTSWKNFVLGRWPDISNADTDNVVVSRKEALLGASLLLSGALFVGMIWRRPIACLPLAALGITMLFFAWRLPSVREGG